MNTAQETSNKPLSCFLQDLEAELAWEWKWMRMNRAWTFGFQWASWCARILLLAAAIYQLTAFAKGKVDFWLVAFIALFSTLNLVLPFVATSFRFAQRLQVHDQTARAYDNIRVELRANRIDLAEAVDRYKEIRKESPESLVRKMP